MGQLKDRLLAAAAVRTAEVEIDGETYSVREVGATAFAEYGRLIKSDPRGASAVLLAECVLEADGSPALNIEEAKQVAQSLRVTMPLVAKILELSGFSEKEPDAG